MKYLGLSLIFITQSAFAQWSSDPVVTSFKLQDVKRANSKQAQDPTAEQALQIYNERVIPAIHGISQADCNCESTTNVIFDREQAPFYAVEKGSRYEKGKNVRHDPRVSVAYVPESSEEFGWITDSGTELSAHKIRTFSRSWVSVNVGLQRKDSVGRRFDATVACGKDKSPVTPYFTRGKDCHAGFTFTQKFPN